MGLSYCSQEKGLAFEVKVFRALLKMTSSVNLSPTAPPNGQAPGPCCHLITVSYFVRQ